MVPLPQRAPRNRRRGAPASSDPSELVITRREFLASVGSSTSVVLSPLNFKWLKNVARSFERVRWHACRFEWAPSVGTTVSGAVAIAMDWGNKSVSLNEETGFYHIGAPSEDQAYALSPLKSGPLWEPKVLALPADKLMSRAWYEVDVKSDTYDTAPGSLVVYLASPGQAGVVGSVWCTYTVRLSGTHSA
nr:putative coat protein [Nufsystermes virus]